MQAAGLQPAHKRICGSYMGTVRKYRHTKSPDSPPLDIAFLSPTHGLFPASCRLPNTTTQTRLPDQYKPTLHADFANLLRYRKYNAIFVAGDATTRRHCQPLRTLTQLDTDADTTVTFASGRHGTQLTQLTDWLHTPPTTHGTFAVSAQVK